MPPNRNCCSVKLATMCEIDVNSQSMSEHREQFAQWNKPVTKTHVRARKWLRDTESGMGEGVWKLKENEDWAWGIKSSGNGWLLSTVNILLQSSATGHNYNCAMHVLPHVFYHMCVNSWRYSHTKHSHFLLHCIGKLGTGKKFHEYLRFI